MAWWERALAALPDSLSSTPGTHREEGENRLSELPSDLHLIMHVLSLPKVCLQVFIEDASFL